MFMVRRVVAIGLLMLAAASPLCLRALAVDSAQPVECHFHAGRQSTLRTADHGCCQNGHDAALIEAAVPALPAAGYDFERLPVFGISQHSTRTMAWCAGPPVSPPLLI
jgi:hypothetical protein